LTEGKHTWQGAVPEGNYKLVGASEIEGDGESTAKILSEGQTAPKPVTGRLRDIL